MNPPTMVALALMLSATVAFAQDGALDPSFGPGDFGTGRVVVAFNLGGDDIDIPRGVAVDAQGRVVVVGTLTTDTNSIIGVVRLLANGQLDPAFSSDGKATLIFAAAKVEARAVVIQPDGKILIAGQTQFGANNDRDFLVVRLLANGSVDLAFGDTGVRKITFDEPGEIRESANAIALGKNGRILVAGIAADMVSTTHMAVARLTADGDLDTSFNGDGRKSFSFSRNLGKDAFRAVKELADGSVILAGNSTASGNLDFAVVHLLENGAFDPAFGNYSAGKSLAAFDLGGSNGDDVRGLAVSDTGSIFVVGSVSNGPSISVIGVAKFDASGELDVTLSGSGRQIVDFAADGANYTTASSVVLQGNGAIVVSGSASTAGVANYELASARLMPNGVLDTSYGTTGRRLFGFDLGSDNRDFTAQMVLSNGKLVSAGGVQRAFNGGLDQDFGILRQTIELGNEVFTDGFE